MATTVPSGQGYLHLTLDCIPSLLDVNFLSWPSVAGMILHKTLMKSRVYSVNSPFHPRLNKQEKQDELASLGIRCVLSLSGGVVVCGCSFLVAQLTWSHLHSHEVHCFTKLNLDPFFFFGMLAPLYLGYVNMLLYLIRSLTTCQQPYWIIRQGVITFFQCHSLHCVDYIGQELKC